MNILAIDTSTSLASIAIATDDFIAAESLVNTNRTLSARLVPEIERLLATAGLAISEIDVFASSIGPGSFTGVRGGVATIQGLALATGKPCVGFSSLTMLAMNFTLSTRLICPMLDARKKEVYAALYDCSRPLPSSCIADCVLPPAVLLDMIAATTKEPVIFLGDGTVRYRESVEARLGSQAVFAPFQHNAPRVANSMQLVQQAAKEGKLLEPSQLLPVYLRASDAEIMKVKSAAQV